MLSILTGPIRPEDVLPDGVETATYGGTVARKGSVAALVANAKPLPTLPVDAPGRAAILDLLRELVPSLRAVGVLDVFVPRDPAIAALIEQC